MTATNEQPAKDIEGVIVATDELRRWADSSGDATAVALAAAITHHNWHARDTMPAPHHYKSGPAQRALAAVIAGDLPHEAFNNEAAGARLRTTTGEQAVVVLHLLHEVGAPANLLSVLADAYGIDPSVRGAEDDWLPLPTPTNARWAHRHRGGVPYVPPPRSEGKAEDQSTIYLRNPDLIDRGTTAHKDTQDALADCLTQHGLVPISPGPGDQQFDIAWTTGQALHLCEVKSLTDDNEESQLRLGLGQLLSYLHRTRVEDWDGVTNLKGVLAVERSPTRTDWIDICAANGVTLTWPDQFSALFED